MIRITRHLYINVLTAVIFAAAWFNRTLGTLAEAYCVMIIHELAHTCAALAIGLMPAYIALHPFGVNLRLAGRVTGGIWEDVILYLSGPCANLVMALAARMLGVGEYFIRTNIVLGCMNLMPVLPLDGGIIVKSALSRRFGEAAADRVMKAASAVITACFIAAAVYTAIRARLQFSALLLCVLMIGNLFTQREKYRTDFLRELIYYRNKLKTGKRARVRIYRRGDDLRRLAREFTSGTVTLAAVVGDDGGVSGVLTEEEVIDALTQGREIKKAPDLNRQLSE